MFDLNSLPIPGSVLVAGIAWAAISTFVLAPVVADRTIQNTGWHKICEAGLRNSVAAQTPQAQSTPKIGCGEIMSIFGSGADQLCDQGGDAFFALMMVDPLAQQKEQVRKREAERLARIADQAPSRCTCASSLVASDRVRWGLYSGSARLIGKIDTLDADLTQALHSPDCVRLGAEFGKDGK